MGLIHRNRPTRPTVLVASLRDVTFGIGRAAMLSILGVCSASAQSIIHVPADQPTIQAGINAASNGDTVLVSPGTYNENIDYKGKGITVTSGATAYSGATATIINGSTDGPVVNLSTNEPSTTVLNGFTIEGAHAFSGPGVVSAGVAISGSSAIVSNNIITQNLGCGVLVYNLASPVIEGNDIRQTRAPQAGEQSLSGVCYSSPAGEGLAIAYAGTVTVTGNIIEDNSTLSPYAAVSPQSSAGIFIIPTVEVKLINNIVRNNQGDAIDGLYYASDGSGTSDTIVLVQNLFYTDASAPASADSGIYLQGNESPLTQRSSRLTTRFIVGEILRIILLHPAR